MYLLISQDMQLVYDHPRLQIEVILDNPRCASMVVIDPLKVLESRVESPGTSDVGRMSSEELLDDHD